MALHQSKMTSKQTIANKKWQQDNKERAKYLSDRSRARSFIRNKANADDLDELGRLIAERRQELNNPSSTR